jgi:hypothetical protein
MSRFDFFNDLSEIVFTAVTSRRNLYKNARPIKEMMVSLFIADGPPFGKLDSPMLSSDEDEGD